MPLVPYVRPEEATGEARAVFDQLTYGKRSLVLEALANHPPLLRTAVAMVDDVLLGGNLDTVYKELVGVVVSQENDCRYCVASHRENLFKLRMPGEHVRAVARREYDALPERQRAVAVFAERAATDAAGGTAADHEVLHAAGFSEEDAVELLGVVGHFMAMNTWTSSLGVDPADRDDTLPRYLDVETEDLDDLATAWRSA